MELKLRHSVPLEMPFHMVSLFAEIGSISVWSKTMDYIIIVRCFANRDVPVFIITPHWKVL